MDRILIVGAAGSLGVEVCKLLAQSQVPFRALASRQESAEKLKPYTSDIWIADCREPDKIQGLCNGIDIVFSSLGKSVSLFTHNPGDFEEIDYEANRNLIKEASNSKVRRFVYCSIKGSESGNGLKLAEVHKKVQNLIEESFASYSIIKPTGFFSGLNDWLIIGKRGVILLPGPGNYRTNPIHSKDLAAVVVDNLYRGPKKLEVGGPEVFTRNEMASIVREKTKAKIIHVPEWMIKLGLPLIGLWSKSLAQNLNYFRYVTT